MGLFDAQLKAKQQASVGAAKSMSVIQGMRKGAVAGGLGEMRKSAPLNRVLKDPRRMYKNAKLPGGSSVPMDQGVNLPSFGKVRGR